MTAKKKITNLSEKDAFRLSSKSVLIRDRDKRVYVIPLDQLQAFRSKDLEANKRLVEALDGPDRIQGLLNAWLMEGYTIVSGDSEPPIDR